MWFVFALLSACFAALTTILAKVGMDGVNSNLATAIRTVVVLVMAWGMVFLTGAQQGISSITPPARGFFGAFRPGDGRFLAVFITEPYSSAMPRW